MGGLSSLARSQHYRILGNAILVHQSKTSLLTNLQGNLDHPNRLGLGSHCQVIH